MSNFIQKHRLLSILIAGLCVSITCSSASAEEGGSGHYTPGGMATLIDLPPTQSGWVVQPLYLHYDADFSGSRTLPIGGLISTELDATIDALTLGGLYTFEQPVLGAHYTVGVYAPYVWMDVTGTVEGTQATRSRTDNVDGLGDITLIPAMLAWTSGSWQFNALLPIYAPTGDYEVGRLANPGLNYWTFDPTVGVAYSNEETGFNFVAFGGVTINTENEDTNYRSGSVLHVDFSVQQLWTAGSGLLGLGLNGFLYEQITGDSGSGAIQGDFKGRSAGIGPVIDYVLPSGTSTWVFEAKWLPELYTKNRLEGDYLWFKAVYQF
jgi:hypothetical protein